MSDSLNSRMEFDCVIRVDAAGTVTDEHDVYGPEVVDFGGGDVHVSESRWTLLDGYSGQDRYSGPVMHPSEFIGGAMERDILATPGLYVAVVVEYDSDDGSEEPSGWAVAYTKGDDDG